MSKKTVTIIAELRDWQLSPAGKIDGLIKKSYVDYLVRDEYIQFNIWSKSVNSQYMLIRQRGGTDYYKCWLVDKRKEQENDSGGSG